MIRWSYAGPRLAVLALLWAFFALAFDPLLRRGLEKAGSAALGARVEVGSLRTRFFPPSVELRRVAAADPGEPMKNLVEIAAARFGLEGRPLLERKAVVPAASLTGLALGTTRTRSGALPKAPPSQAAVALKRWADTSKEVSLGAAGRAKEDAVARYQVKPEDLASLRLADELERNWPARFDALRGRVNAFDVQGRVRELERLADQAAKGDVASKLASAAELRRRLEELRTGADALRQDADAQLRQARSDLDAVRAAKRADLDAIRSRLKLPSFDTAKLSAYLLGPQAAARLTKGLRFIEAARQRMPSGPPAKAAPRGSGLTVEFPRERSWPAFWLRAAELSGAIDLGGPLELRGDAADFSSNPALVGRPARLTLRGAQGARKALLEATFDHAGAVPRDALRFEYDGLPMPATIAGDPAGFAVAIGPGSASVSGEIAADGPRLSGTIRFRQTGVTLTPSGGPPEAARLLAAAFRGLDRLEAQLTLGGTLEAPEFQLSSNLGRALSQGLQKALGEEAQARLRQAQDQAARLVDAKLGQLDSQLGAQSKDVLGKLGLGDEKLRALQDRLKRELRVPSVPGLKLFQ